MLNALLWGNSLIKRKNQPIFDSSLVNSNINRVMDIYDFAQNKFMTFNQIVETYRPNFDYLFYLGILSAIPKWWKTSIKIDECELPIDITTRIVQISDKKHVSKTVYWTVLQTKHPVSSVTKTLWEYDLKCHITDDEWFKLYTNFRKSIKSTKLQYFQYRVLTRALTTNVRLVKWGKCQSNRCTFCHEHPETVIHLLVECKIIESLWKKLEKVIAYFFIVKVLFNKQVIIFNNYNGKCSSIINQCIATLKQYVYASKCFEKLPQFCEFMTKMSYWYSSEKYLIYQQPSEKAWKKFHQKWNNLF